MGTLFSAYLSAGGLDVTLIDHRKDRAKAISEKGIHIDGVRGKLDVKLPVTGDAAAIGPCDLVIVLVKAYATASAIKQHVALIGDNTAVLTLQNGIGNIEKIAEVAGANKTLGGSTTMGANLAEPGVVNHAGEGDTLIGELNGQTTPRVEQIVEAFNKAGITAKIAEDIKASIWTKLIINAAINPLTALLGVQNGVLAEQQSTLDLMAKIVDETIVVAKKADNIELDREALSARVVEVCRLTAKNRSSMLMDVLNRRPTEIGAISGAICEFADKSKTAAPANESLFQLVRALENTYDLRQS
jgi:2-dehydropantoate 2-reductase